MNIDFIEPTLPSRRAWILALLPAVLALALWCVAINLHTQLDRQREQVAAAEFAAKVPTTPPVVHRRAPVYQTDAYAALTRAALPEADALAEIEHVEVPGIQLRSIDVNPGSGLVVVELDAARDEALGDYLDQLNAGNAPPKWHIQKLAATTNASRSTGASVSTGVQPDSGHLVVIARGL